MKNAPHPLLRLVIAISLAVMLSCSSSSSTQPIDLDLNGGWSYNAILISDGFDCLGSAQLQISHSGSNVGGTYNGLQIMCDSPEFIQVSYGNGSIVNGNLAGSTVNFALGSSNWQQSGGVVRDHTGRAYVIQGQVNVTADLGQPWGTRTFVNNTWQAIR